MRVLFSFVILFAVLLQSSINAALWLHYEYNKTYIAKNLCENRFVADSCCKGKCYLKKELAKQDEQSPKDISTKAELKKLLELHLFCESISSPQFCVYEEKVSNPYITTYSINDGVNSEVFHPPTV